MVAVLFLLKPDRLEAYPTFAMVSCAAKPASPTLRKIHDRAVWLFHQRSISVHQRSRF